MKGPQYMEDSHIRLITVRKRRAPPRTKSTQHTHLRSGPLGTLLKKNLQDKWWRDFVVSRMDCVALDTSIIVNPKVWHASGHVENFTDPLVECKICNKRVRADHLLEQMCENLPSDTFESLDSISRELKRVEPKLSECKKRKCDFSSPRNFNLLFQSQVGCTEDTSQNVFLRPETAQGVYVNFTQVMNSMRKTSLPVGIGQIGKAFRNEITLGNFIFRTREFEQMELQYFCEQSSSMSVYDYWVEMCETWLRDTIGLRSDSVRET